MILNLVSQRSGPSIWAREPMTEWDGERWLLAMAAGALLFTGLRRRTMPGLLLALGLVLLLVLPSMAKALKRTARKR